MAHFSNEETDQIQLVVRDTIGVLNPEDAERTGGCFVYYDGHEVSTHAQPPVRDIAMSALSVGEMPVEKQYSYMRNAFEKVIRLIHNVLDKRSYTSRDPELSRWGGAIRLPNGVILSFSGFPELADEAAMLYLAVLWNLISKEDAEAWALESDNFYYQRLMTVAPALQAA